MLTIPELIRATNFAWRVYANKNPDDATILKLSEFKLFSAAQLAQITGLSRQHIYRKVPSENLAAGGRFSPLSLLTANAVLLVLERGEKPNPKIVAALIADGNSYRMISRLTTLSVSQIQRMVDSID